MPLHSSSEPSTTADLVRPTFRRRRFAVVLLVLISVVLGWFNGPGFRWLLPILANRWFAEQGLVFHATVSGTLVGGFSLHEVAVSGPSLRGSVVAKQIFFNVSLESLLRQQVPELRIHSLHVFVDLPPSVEKNGRLDSEQNADLDSENLIDPVAWQRQLTTAHTWLGRCSIDTQDIQIQLTRSGHSWLTLGPSSLRHLPNTNLLSLNLGSIIGPDGRTWPKQTSRITLTPASVHIDQISPLPDLTLTDTLLEIPGVSLEKTVISTSLRWQFSQFHISAWPVSGTARIDLTDGKLDLSRALHPYQPSVPLDGVVESLSLELSDLLPDGSRVTGKAQLAASSVSWENFPVADSLVMDAAIQSSALTLQASADCLDTRADVSVSCPLLRHADGTFSMGPLSGTLAMPAVHQAWLAGMRAISDPSTPAPPCAPDSGLSARFEISPSPLQPHQIRSQIQLQPKQSSSAAPLELDFRWSLPSEFQAVLSTPNWRTEASYHAISRHYHINSIATGFETQTIVPWLNLANFKVPGRATLDATLQGSGELRKNLHQGRFTLNQLVWTAPDLPMTRASALIDYDWPNYAKVQDLSLASAEHRLLAQLSATPTRVSISESAWSHAGKQLATFRGSLPLSTDALEAIDFECAVGPLTPSTLTPWLGALPPEVRKTVAELDPAATLRVGINVAGTPQAPQVDGRLDLIGLRHIPSHTPPTDIQLKLETCNDNATLTGSLSIPNAPVAKLNATLPFRPHEWLADPMKLKKEPFTARLDLPLVQFSRFTELLPQVSRAEGGVQGHFEATGALGAPALRGKLSLNAPLVVWKSSALPEIRNLTGNIDFTPQEISLNALRATLAAGSLDASGKVRLLANQPPILDFRLVGRHLPIRRDASLILRSHTDLRLTGPWNRALLTGSAGIVDSLFFRDIEILPLGTPFTAPSAAALPKIDAAVSQVPAVPIPFRDWLLDLRIETQNPFLIRGNIATGQIEANLRIGGTLGSPQPDGTATLSDFTAALPFSTLKVRRGTVRFTPSAGFDPTLEIRGFAEPRPYRVDAYLYGRASNPQLVLTSNPPMPENEIMTLLATGTTTSGLENPAAASSRAMQLFAEELRRGRFSIGKPLRPLLGLLDRVDFSLDEDDPYSGDSLSTATITLSDRWLLSAGMAAEGGSRLLAIWRISFR